MSDCCQPKPQPETPTVNPATTPATTPAAMSHSCCDSAQGDQGTGAKSARTDWIFWGSAVTLLASLVVYHSGWQGSSGWQWLYRFADAESNLIKEMWWGMAIGILSIGVMNLIPKQHIRSAFGTQTGWSGILRAGVAGIVLDLCNHGILLIAAKLYNSGVRYSQVLTFLIASPWNSLSLTIVMLALLGWQWTLVFVVGSFLIAVITGLIVDAMERGGKIAANPASAEVDSSTPVSLREHIAQVREQRGIARTLFVDSIVESKMIMRWLLLGMVLAALIKTFVSADIMQTWFGATVLGLLATLVAATIIEVCSEGLLPVAADLMTRAAAPGNAFAFLMAGVSTDYTEMLVLREVTGRWKMAFLLPLITLPQIILFAWMLNL
ncbi:MAG: permease [Pseudomonadota bacterium]|nr:permease [Pseudomonadota bacterium]